jgi:hypothetical protein
MHRAEPCHDSEPPNGKMGMRRCTWVRDGWPDRVSWLPDWIYDYYMYRDGKEMHAVMLQWKGSEKAWWGKPMVRITSLDEHGDVPP